MPKKFHLGWFTNFTVDEWNDPFASGGGKPWNGKYYVEMARALERACFDYLMLEDTAAQNFGLDKLPPRESRYAMAHEYMDVVNQLFASWDPDAVVMDRETDT